jgi:hypothetical protein
MNSQKKDYKNEPLDISYQTGGIITSDNNKVLKEELIKTI